MKKETQQLEVTTHLIRNLKGYSDEKIKKEGVDRKDVITSSDKTVLVTLSTWINVPNNIRKGIPHTRCWVAQEMICEQTLLSKRTVQECINKLIRLGYLLQIKKGRTGVASEYEVVLGDVVKVEKKFSEREDIPVKVLSEYQEKYFENCVGEEGENEPF